jgi:hypothetical protein
VVQDADGSTVAIVLRHPVLEDRAVRGTLTITRSDGSETTKIVKVFLEKDIGDWNA